MFHRRKNKNKDKNRDLKKKEESQKSINRRINANKSSLKSAITEYVSPKYAFSAIVKQSYFDFQVHEISIDGEIVHLTEPLTQEYEEKRRLLDLVGKRLNPYKLTEFVMCKENMTMKEALHTLKISDGTPKLKMERIMTSETIDRCQDRKAITSQLVTIRNENFDVERLCRELKCQSNIAVGNFRLVHKRVKQGHFKGNRFIMALRNVIGYKNHIVVKLESLKNVGFINYNGTKCYVNAPMQLIGKSVLLQEWQTVFHSLSELPVSALLSDLPGEFKQFHNISLARLVDYTLPQKVRKDIQIFDKSLRPLWVEDVQKFVLNLKSHNNHYTDITIETIPAKIRLFFIIAYQRFLWDAVVSKRLAKFGLKPIVGDLVYVPVSDGGEDDVVQVEANNLSSNYTGDDDESSNSRHQWKVIFVNENNHHNYTIHDVVLPLPGYNITYPANEVADWYKDLLLADGLSETDFERSDKDFALENLAYNFSATYRPLILKPSDVKWRFERYHDKSLSLIPSDLDRMKNTQPPCSADKGGRYLALILELSLPTSSNVSMALREITKKDVSAEFQTSLTDLLAEMPQKGAACWHKSYVKYLEKKTKRDQKRKRSVPTSETPKESNWQKKKLKRSMESQWKNRKLKRAMESVSKDKESAKDPNTTQLEEEQQISNTNVLVANHAEKEIELKRKTSQALFQDSASSEDAEMLQIEQEPSCIKKSAPIDLDRPTIFVVERMKMKEEPGTSHQRQEETNNPLKASEEQIIFVDLTSD